MSDVDPLDLVETIREGILVLAPDLTIRFANSSFCQKFAVAPEQTKLGGRVERKTDNQGTAVQLILPSREDS